VGTTTPVGRLPSLPKTLSPNAFCKLATKLATAMPGLQFVSPGRRRFYRVQRPPGGGRFVSRCWRIARLTRWRSFAFSGCIRTWGSACLTTSDWSGLHVSGIRGGCEFRCADWGFSQWLATCMGRGMSRCLRGLPTAVTMRESRVSHRFMMAGLIVCTLFKPVR
jgi:hypothetical protein